MPSLMPGMAGAKEAFGISVIRSDHSIVIPPKAIDHYEITDNSIVVLTTTHRNESGFSILNKERAEKSVLNSKISKIDQMNRIFWDNKKAYVTTLVTEGKIKLNNEMMNVFHLKPGMELMSVKSTTIALSFTPVEIWKKKFLERGLKEAADNIDTLPIFS